MSLRSLALIIALGASLFSLSCKSEVGVTGGVPIGDQTDEEAIRQMDAYGQALAEQGNYEAVYEFASPEYRDACSMDRFVRAGRFASILDEILKSHPREGEIVRVVVTGDRAVVTSLDYSPANDELSEDTSEAVKVEDRWFFAADDEDLDACASEMFASDDNADASAAVFRFALLRPQAKREGGLPALGLVTLSGRFLAECPLQRFVTSEPAMTERLVAAFDDPFTWTYQSSDGRVSIDAPPGAVAELLHENGEWKIDSIADLAVC